MVPRTGRPPKENPRNHHLGLRLTEEDYRNIEEAREKDKEPERSLSAWASRKMAELAKKMIGKK